MRFQNVKCCSSAAAEKAHAKGSTLSAADRNFVEFVQLLRVEVASSLTPHCLIPASFHGHFLAIALIVVCCDPAASYLLLPASTTGSTTTPSLGRLINVKRLPEFSTGAAWRRLAKWATCRHQVDVQSLLCPLSASACGRQAGRQSASPQQSVAAVRSNLQAGSA